MGSERQKSNGNGAGYEKSDANPRALALFAAIIIATLALAFVIAASTFRYFASAQTLGAPSSQFAPARVLPPEPRLQPDPRLDLQRMRQEESTNLNSYGWVNPNAGAVRIPINRAMDRILEKGLPVQGQEAGKK